MRRFILGIALAAVALALWASTARAAGPAPGTGPWIAGTDTNCHSGYHELVNTASGNAHCFRN